MDRRRFLRQGLGILPLVFSGCVDGARPPSERETSTAKRGQPGYEDLLLHGESTTQTIHIAVFPTSNPQETLVNGRYEVPSDLILQFPDLLERGIEYRFEATPPQGEPSRKTLTVEGCGPESEAPTGERPIVIYAEASEPSILFKGCDTLLGAEYVDAGPHNVTNASARDESATRSTAS